MELSKTLYFSSAYWFKKFIKNKIAYQLVLQQEAHGVQLAKKETSQHGIVITSLTYA